MKRTLQVVVVNSVRALHELDKQNLSKVIVKLEDGAFKSDSEYAYLYFNHGITTLTKTCFEYMCQLVEQVVYIPKSLINNKLSPMEYLRKYPEDAIKYIDEITNTPKEDTIDCEIFESHVGPIKIFRRDNEIRLINLDNNKDYAIRFRTSKSHWYGTIFTTLGLVNCDKRIQEKIKTVLLKMMHQVIYEHQAIKHDQIAFEVCAKGDC